MGRHNNANKVPQRSRLVADRELRMAIKTPLPKPFGIRRTVAFGSQVPLLEKFAELSRDGAIPEHIYPRRRLHTTLLPLRELDAQLTRGLVLGYEFGKGIARVENNIKEEYSGQVHVRLSEAAVIKSRYLAIKIDSERLDDEHFVVRQTMGRLGLRGSMRQAEPLHITLGDATEKLTRFEKKDIVSILNEYIVSEYKDEEKLVVLEPLDFYSRDDDK